MIERVKIGVSTIGQIYIYFQCFSKNFDSQKGKEKKEYFFSSSKVHSIIEEY